MTNLDSIFKSRDITLPTKVHLVKAMVFPVVMYECKGWSIKKAEHQRIDAFELWCWRRFLGALDCKEIQPVHSNGDQSWVFIGRTNAEAETPILRVPDVKSWLIWKDPDAGKDWGQEEKGMTEDEMVVWHHRLNGHEFEQAPGDGEGQGTWPAAVHGVAKSWTWLSDWTATITTVFMDWNIKHINDVHSHPNWSVSLTLASKHFVPIDKFILNFVQMNTSPRIAK